MDAERYHSLTPTERDVLRRIGGGSRPGEIATQLGRSVSTINNHLQAARMKLTVSDSLTAARALLAYEISSQILPRQQMPMVAGRVNQPDTKPQEPDAWSAAVLNEERTLFEHAPSWPANHPDPSAGGWPRELTKTPWRRMAGALTLTMLLLACIGLAPAMAETYQLIIDRLFPLHH